jgi:hypothetical protein
VGDFNFHVDNRQCKDARKFCDILESFDLVQHVNQATHDKGHTLDLVITRSSEQLIDKLQVKDMVISDHFCIHFLMEGRKLTTAQKEISYRKMKSIDLKEFESDLNSSDLRSIFSHKTTECAVHTYNKELGRILDKHAPIITRTVVIHPDSPWYNQEIDQAKKARRAAESVWRKSQLTIHREIFIEKKTIVNNLIKSAKETHYSHLISQSSDQKMLFKVFDKISHKKSESVLPTHTSKQELAVRFGTFFKDKIVKIRNRIDSSSHLSQFDVEEEHTPPSLTQFSPATPEEVKRIISNSKATTCRLDPMPTSFLKLFVDFLVPYLTYVINLSFEESHIPFSLKKALILPLLKKPGLDIDTLANFRPVSNLSYLSKLIERVIASRILEHMSINNLHEIFQSSYKQFHSVETALLRVQSDILTALDDRKCVLLIMLDLSAAFDTIDHPTLLTRLKSVLGISGKALKWLASYLSDRTQSVLIDGVESSIWELIYGIPQGSVLGPILFIIYTSPLGKILEKLGVKYHFYADDSQIYLSFKIDEAKSTISKVEHAVDVIRAWMAKNFLCLNDSKTEVLLIGSKSSHDKLDIPYIKIGSEDIPPSLDARNIGFVFDHIMSCKKHINLTCKSAWNQLRNVGRIRQFLDDSSTERLIHAFVTSKLDINNALLYGLPDALLHKLQRVQNAAARMVVRLPKHCHITPVLTQLHWLPVPHRIQYKILLMVFKALNNLSPSYIRELLVCKEKSMHSLRSDDQNFLVEPRSRTVTYGDRNFKTVAPRLWNELPLHIRSLTEVECFKKELKTFLFRQAYQ